MNKQLKTKWLEALRSGEYKQTRGTLKDQIGYCCLGVLCDILDVPKNEEGDFIILGDIRGHGGEYTEMLNVAASNPAGITFRRYLAHQNDSGLSFQEIADYIEENL